MSSRKREKPEVRRGLFKPSTREPLAIDPRALAAEFSYSPGAAQDCRRDDGVCIVSVQGPLEHHAGPCWESFESVLERVECFMRGDDVVRTARINEEIAAWREQRAPEPVEVEPEPARAVVMVLDSPGGEAAGSMQAHDKLRRFRKKYGVPLYAYANELAASAAYALASAADEIWLPATGIVGSIGVVATLFDRTQMNRQQGLEVQLVTSGKFKADNHADRVLTGGIRSRTQKRVDDLAEIFFSCVAKARGGTPEGVAALEAATFMGKAAVSAGLADGVESLDRFLKLVARSVAGDDDAARAA